MRGRVLALILVALSVVALAGPPTSAAKRRPPKFLAFLTGYEEVPAVSTSAEGEFTGKLVKSGAGTTISYRLTYQNIQNATAAHLHLGQYGVNGGVIAFLCGGGDKPACPATGGTVGGVIDAADVTGPAAQGIAAGELSEAIAAMKFGVVYVNVHTDDAQGQKDTGPGDLSTGEIRGQVVWTGRCCPS